MNDEEMHKMYLTHFLYKNGIIEPKPEVKKDKKSDSEEVKIFLVNGKTLYFTNVSKKEDLIDEKGYPYLVLHYFDKRINKQRIAYFEMTNGNVIGYAEDK